MPAFDWGSDLGAVLRADRVVAVLRAPHYAAPGRLAAGLAQGGIRVVEFTLTADNALEAIAAAAGTADVIVGAGSVLTASDARAALDAGARFLVSPITAPPVVAAASDTPVLLAGRTPTEIHHAWSLTGAPVKLFPADLDGPGYVRSLLAPMPALAIMPSGGIDAGNVAEYLRAGAVAVNVGGALCPPEALRSGDGTALTERARRLRAAIDAT